MPLPPKLVRELDELRSCHPVQVLENADFVELIFENFSVGEGFSPQSSDILIRVPRSYPDTGPDMFWTNPDLRLSNGGVPQNAELIETYGGRQWRRFSWHKSAWNAAVDNIHGYVEFIRRRLRTRT